MPKKRKHALAHRADTCNKAIRKECRFWRIKRHQYDIAFITYRMRTGRTTYMEAVAREAVLLFFTEEEAEERLARSWKRDAHRIRERRRSRGYVMKKTTASKAKGMRAFSYRKVRRKR